MLLLIFGFKVEHEVGESDCYVLVEQYHIVIKNKSFVAVLQGVHIYGNLGILQR